MNLIVFAVFDSATQMYGTPMFLVSRGQAVRSFSDEVNRGGQDNQLHNHPEDFELYQLGEYSTEDGLLIARDLELVVRGKDVKNS